MGELQGGLRDYICEETPMADRTIATLPGPKSRELCTAGKEWMAPGGLTAWDLAGVAFESGEGIELVDVDGNRYLDVVSANGVAALGYGHKRVSKAISEQSAR